VPHVLPVLSVAVNGDIFVIPLVRISVSGEIVLKSSVIAPDEEQLQRTVTLNGNEV
jgi:hypothetical protein